MPFHVQSTNIYKFDKYSVFDIQTYLQSRGIPTTLTATELLVDETDVRINIPFIDINGLVFSSIILVNYKPKYDRAKSKKIYELLKRKFGLRKNEPVPQNASENIKDADRLTIRRYGIS